MWRCRKFLLVGLRWHKRERSSAAGGAVDVKALQQVWKHLQEVDRGSKSWHQAAKDMEKEDLVVLEQPPNTEEIQMHALQTRNAGEKILEQVEIMPLGLGEQLEQIKEMIHTMEKKKKQVEAQAEKNVQRILATAWTILLVQALVTLRMTYWELR